MSEKVSVSRTRKLFRGFALTILLSSFAFAGSSKSDGHRYMRGTVVMKMSDNRVHVCLGDNVVSIGSKVTFYNSICKKSYSGGRDGVETVNCKMHKLGTGTVIKLANEHYSTVKIDGNVQVQEGTLVERTR